jgi:hypothetical protein
VVDYLRFTRDFNAQFPGFGADVHGLVAEEQVPGGPKRYFVDCVQTDPHRRKSPAEARACQVGRAAQASSSGMPPTMTWLKPPST